MPELTRRALQATVSEGLTEGPYVSTRVEFEPAAATLLTEGTEPNTTPPRPMTLTLNQLPVDFVFTEHLYRSCFSLLYVLRYRNLSRD